jgi:hypothetical protein
MKEDIIIENDEVGVNITTDGTPEGTKVCLDNGDRISGITHLSIDLDAVGMSSIVLHIIPKKMDINIKGMATVEIVDDE